MFYIQIHLTLFTAGKLTTCKKESMNIMVWVNSKLGLADINLGGYCKFQTRKETKKRLSFEYR